VLPVLQEAAEELPKDREPPPESLDAKLETFFRTCLLPQVGQFTSVTWLELRSSSSKGFPQSLHSNSNNGMRLSSKRNVHNLSLDAGTGKR
jgi:hypothetical protein